MAIDAEREEKRFRVCNCEKLREKCVWIVENW